MRQGGPREDSYPSIIGLRLPQPAVVSLLGMAVGVQPGQEATNAPVCQSNARIRGAVVEIDGVAVCSNGIATGEHDVLNISVAFVIRFGGEHPGISTDQTFLGLFEIEKGQTETIYGTGGRSADAVVDHQPASGRFDRRR